MAVYNSSIAQLHSYVILPFLRIFMIPFLLSVMIPTGKPLSFNLSSFDPNEHEVVFAGHAYSAADKVIQLTINQQDRKMNDSWGRATYDKPFQLWDKASKIMADFCTNFSFQIDSLNNDIYGDGLAFFLVPNGTQLPSDVTGGGLGLVSKNQELNSTANHFFAVEFDTFSNDWDPKSDHVGIDINSMKSVENVTWASNIPGGKNVHVSIWYASSSKNLSVMFGANDSSLQSFYYIVDLTHYLPEWVVIGFSSATGSRSEIHSIYSWSFSSSGLPDSGSEKKNQERKKKTGLVAGLSVGGCTLLASGLGLVCFCLWKKCINDEEAGEEPDFDLSMDDDFENGTGPRKFSHQELVLATNNFAEGKKLGEGGFGGVYKGFLRNPSSYIAVKRVSRGSKQGIKEYASEVKIISRLRHRNLVQLMGWCHQKRELLLVYEFMPNGSLDSHLFKGKTLLTWAMRYKIATGLASALLYLHEEWEKCVVHRDVKSSNVMLDADFNAKLGDFGLARLVDHGRGSQTTVLAGTIGYMAPECLLTGNANKESDVYSFGIVVLEICCGRKSVEIKAQENEIILVEWVWELYGVGKLLDAADQRLSTDFDEEQMERLMIVGLWCAHPDCNLRPAMRQAVNVLNSEASLPVIPSNMPVPIYYASPANTSAFSLEVSHSATVSKRGQSQLPSFSAGTDSSNFTSS